jgi:hypothetical protein
VSVVRGFHTNSHDEPLRPAHTPFLEETGDDCGLGGGVCVEAPDDTHGIDDYIDIEQTLHELPQSARVGEELRGLYSHGYTCEDVDDYHVVGTERRERSHGMVRVSRLGRICVETKRGWCGPVPAHAI